MQTLRFEAHDGIGTLTLSRPKALNALNGQLIDELDALLGTAELAAVRALVVTGEGRAFAAGADISEMAGMDSMRAEGMARRGQAVLRRLELLPIPTIAAVNGFALGGGCELAMACDLILAGPKAKFGQPEVKLGVIPGFGGTQRLVQRVGTHHALEIMMTGRMVDAEEAVRLGLALRLEEDVVVGAKNLASAIASNGPVAVRLVKRAVRETAGVPLDLGLAAESSLFGLCFATDDQKEGMAAFLDGQRSPAFRGR